MSYPFFGLDADAQSILAECVTELAGELRF
jgi:hypothetical protein